MRKAAAVLALCSAGLVLQLGGPSLAQARPAHGSPTWSAGDRAVNHREWRAVAHRRLPDELEVLNDGQIEFQTETFSGTVTDTTTGASDSLAGLDRIDQDARGWQADQYRSW